MPGSACASVPRLDRAGFGIDRAVPQVDDDEESFLTGIADLVQDQVTRAHIAW